VALKAIGAPILGDERYGGLLHNAEDAQVHLDLIGRASDLGISLKRHPDRAPHPRAEVQADILKRLLDSQLPQVGQRARAPVVHAAAERPDVARRGDVVTGTDFRRDDHGRTYVAPAETETAPWAAALFQAFKPAEFRLAASAQVDVPWV
jgi:hypothetical protein